MRDVLCKDRNIIEQIQKDIKESDDYNIFHADLLEVFDKYEMRLIYVEDELIGLYFLTNYSFGLYVKPEFRKKGYGTRILERIIERTPKGETLSITVDIRNVPAIKIYKKCGFDVTEFVMKREVT